MARMRNDGFRDRPTAGACRGGARAARIGAGSLTGGASAEANEASGLATENDRRYKILLIEDDPECAALLREEFDRRGYAVFVASDTLCRGCRCS